MVDFYKNVLGLQKKYEFEDYAGFDSGGVEILKDIKNNRKLLRTIKGFPI